MESQIPSPSAMRFFFLSLMIFVSCLELILVSFAQTVRKVTEESISLRCSSIGFQILIHCFSLVYHSLRPKRALTSNVPIDSSLHSLHVQHLSTTSGLG